MLIDVGYGNVVDWGDGTYSVLVHSDYITNGKDGYRILIEYLEANDWYWYSVDEVREKDPMEDYWEDEEIEWID